MENLILSLRLLFILSRPPYIATSQWLFLTWTPPFFRLISLPALSWAHGVQPLCVHISFTFLSHTYLDNDFLWSSWPRDRTRHSMVFELLQDWIIAKEFVVNESWKQFFCIHLLIVCFCRECCQLFSREKNGRIWWLNFMIEWFWYCSFLDDNGITLCTTNNIWLIYNTIII